MRRWPAAPSADITYIMPEARSAVSFALPLDREKIQPLPFKRDHAAHEQDNIELNVRASRLAKELALWLEEKGHAAKRVVANLNYRQEEEGWQLLMHLSCPIATWRCAPGWDRSAGPATWACGATEPPFSWAPR